MTDADTSKSGLGNANKRGVKPAVGIKLQKGGGSGFEAIIEPSAGGVSYWTSTSSSTNYWARTIYMNDSSVYRFATANGAYSCIRCLKNQ
jgi:hypothetical protein